MASSYGEDASKDALRNGYASLGQTLSPALRYRLDREVARHLLAWEAYRRSSLVLAYVASRTEVDAAPIVLHALGEGRKVALPRYVGGSVSLEFHQVRNLDGLRQGACGMLEPGMGQGDTVDEAQMADALCLVPGLVFDGRGYRIGYGAGYYDNFLARFPGLKVGLVRTMQISSNPLPIDAHDVAVDVLVSDGAVWRCR